MTSASPTPLQRRFRFFDESRRAALVTTRVAMDRLGCDEDHVLYLIGEKDLVAFNLAMPGVEKRMPGIWTRSVLLYQEDQAAPDRTMAGSVAGRFDESATAEAIADILPDKRLLRLTELRTIFGWVSSTHVKHLIEAGLLAAQGGDRVSKAPQITRESAAAFLAARRMW